MKRQFLIYVFYACAVFTVFILPYEYYGPFASLYTAMILFLVVHEAFSIVAIRLPAWWASIVGFGVLAFVIWVCTATYEPVRIMLNDESRRIYSPTGLVGIATYFGLTIVLVEMINWIARMNSSTR